VEMSYAVKTIILSFTQIISGYQKYHKMLFTAYIIFLL